MKTIDSFVSLLPMSVKHSRLISLKGIRSFSNVTLESLYLRGDESFSGSTLITATTNIGYMDMSFFLNL